MRRLVSQLGLESIKNDERVAYHHKVQAASGSRAKGTMDNRRYEQIPEFSPEQVEAVILRDDPKELLYAVVSAALHAEDRLWAEGVCVRLAGHPHFNVRGNALLGFGHLARLHGALDAEKVRPLIELGLGDQDPYVRGHAHDAADDVEHFLGWKIARPPVT